MTDLSPPEPEKSQVPPLLHNVLFHFSSRVVIVFLALLTTPILIHRLGTSAYGLYVLSVTVADLLAVLGIALMPAAVVLLSRAVKENDGEYCQRVISTSFLMFLVLGAGVGATLALLVPWLVSDVIRISEEMRFTAQVALWLTTVTFLFTIWAAVFSAIPIALERYDMLSRRIISVLVVNAVLTIVYALLGGNVPGLVAINTLTAGLSLVLLYLLSRSLLPDVHFQPGFDPRTLRALFRFGGFKLMMTVSGGVLARVDQIIISAVVGVQALAFYAVPATISLRVTSMLSELAAPIFPRVSKLDHALTERRRLFLRASRMMLLVTAPVLIILAILGDVLLRLWIRGPEGDLVAREGVTAMRWLLAASLVITSTNVPTTYCEAQGHPEIPGVAFTLTAIVWIPLAIALTFVFGIAGPPMALCVASVLLMLPFVFYMSATQVSVGPRELIGEVLGRPILPSLVIVGLGVLIHPYVANLASFVLAVLALTSAYVISALTLRVFEAEDFLALMKLADRIPTSWPGRAFVVKWGRRLANLSEP